ncbi:MAG: hypothetical protein IKE43_06220 [Coriobacteriales bacterium]|nr:hypothetical protein [Coriobacteriales bacterium]
MEKSAEVILANSVIDALLDIHSKADLQKIKKRLEILPYAPEMGTEYDPLYDAARPVHKVLVTYAGHYGIYYTYNPEQQRIEIEYLCNERTNPLQRFSEDWDSIL